ncbi:SusC/RagA family TonB-linked outer membrane protein [Chitinophaga sp. 212800010-3]|uniref:SusC/RagA family TonB-linked outer membrane protein n=1 Tax=unclassified Chitinophaga TaxID=2619133 RepID=UPI002DEEB82D|nr:SusC/RagA family TonB-linked outer membrane protein [Chitinophaga sp. 212800010-3]
MNFSPTSGSSCCTGRCSLLPGGKSFMLLLFISLMMSVQAIAQGITLDVKRQPLPVILDAISKQTGLRVFYNESMLKDAKPLSLSVKNAPLETVLDRCLKDLPLTYKVVDKVIVLKDKDAQAQQTAPEQQVTDVRGRVLIERNQPAIGATITLKNQTGQGKGAVANVNGEFRIRAAAGDVLIVSFMGYETREVTVDSSAALTIVLQPSSKVLNQVVVTALGIRQENRALSYNVQEIKGEEVTRVPNASFVNSLAGKVAGVTINGSASGIGGSTRVVMRGDKSLRADGNNNALYVLDGIPLPNLFSSNSVRSNGIYGGKDGGDGISSINPEDIASLSVLTGAASSALYGGMAANGAVLITTKNGAAGKPRVSYANNTTFFRPFVLPEFQQNYGASSPGTFDSWGDKLEKPSTFSPKDFFQTGNNETNSISVSSGGEKNITYFSASASNANGIVPNNTFDRYNLTFRNTSYYLDNKLSLDLTGMYIRTKNQNMISQGQYFNPLVPLYLFPRGEDMEKYKLYERYDVVRGFKTQWWPYGSMGLAMQNPYWTVNRDFNRMDKERYILGAALKYKVLDWLDVMGRVRTDNNNAANQVTNYASTLPLLASNSDNGSYLDLTTRTRQTYADVLVSANKTFHSWGLMANAGASLLDSRMSVSGNADVASNGAPLSKVPNLFTSSNVIPQPLPGSQPVISQIQSVYATAQLNYKKMLFLDLTGRNEWPSQLAYSSSTSLFYPSVGLSAVLSDMFNVSPAVLSYLKVRGSYSEVGNPPLPYDAHPGYTTTVAGPGLNRDLPFNLVPERTKSTEAGINASFWHDKINLTVTGYNANTYNQIFVFLAPDGSGYANFKVNAGRVRNRGIEASLGYNGNIGPVKWNANATFTMNRNKIMELAENAVNPFNNQRLKRDTFYMAGIGSASSAAVKNGSIGDIFVNSLVRDPEGYIYQDPSTHGYRVDNTNLIYAGNPNPRYNIGFRNGFSYKQFNFSFLVDARIGGEVVSATQALMDGFGTSKASGNARDKGGVLINGYPSDAKTYYQAVGLGTGVLSQYVYSATNVRLREAALSYTIPARVFADKLRDVTVSVIGNNLFMFYNKAPFDPESTASTGTYFQGIDYFMMPSLRSFGFSVKVNL